MLRQPLIFLDLETTGMAAAQERITEIGLVEVANGEFVGSWSQLVNPQKSIPPFIQSLTGITNAMVRDAPRFEQLAPALFQRLAGKLLIAHNARFDCGFLKTEFARVGMSYSPRVLCTAKLSRKLFPEHRRHNLDSLIERHGLSCSARHRALGDAEVLWQFMQKIHAEVDAERIDAAMRAQMDAPSLPAGLASAAIDAIPAAPGVYLFYDEHGAPLYVGTSVDLLARVRSHFAGDRRPAKIRRISREVARVEWIETAGALGALLAESRLIKELPPLERKRRVARRGKETGDDPEPAQWPYKGAIGLRERAGERTEVHLFERWCFLGTARTEAEIYDKLEVRSEPVFDPGIYKILKRELARRTRGVALIDFGPMSSLWYRGAETPVPG
jgi:DNA polymerase III subunit epsilon